MGTPYSTQAVNGFNASPPADDGSQVAANQVTWATIKTKLADPLNTWAVAIDTALVVALDSSVNQKTSAYTTAAGDHMKTVEVAPSVSSAVTISLGDAATMTNKYMVRVKNSGTGTVTVGRATGGNTIDGVAGNLTLAAGQSVWLGVTSGADGYITLAAFANNTLTSPTIAGTPVFSGSSVTWSGNPTHSGNHTFSGNVTADASLSSPTVRARTVLVGSNNGVNGYQLREVGGSAEGMLIRDGGNGSTLLAVLGGSIGVPSGAKLFIDGVAGTGNTYIREDVADEMVFYAGALNRAKVTSSGFVVLGTLITDGGLQTFGAADSGGAGKRLVLVPN